jgi:outer membrane receptor for Fe3+-dicitrate
MLVKKKPFDETPLKFAPMGQRSKVTAVNSKAGQPKLKVEASKSGTQNAASAPAVANPQTDKVKSYDGSAQRIQQTSLSRSIAHHAGKAARDLEAKGRKVATLKKK